MWRTQKQIDAGREGKEKEAMETGTKEKVEPKGKDGPKENGPTFVVPTNFEVVPTNLEMVPRRVVTVTGVR